MFEKVGAELDVQEERGLGLSELRAFVDDEAMLAKLERIERENRMLSDRLTEGLAHRDLVVLPRADRGAIVTFLPRREPTALVAALRTHGVSVALRAGGVRVAPHIHNGPQHIDRFLNLLDELDR